MSLMIRLSKVGRKGEHKYRVVVKEKRSKRSGAYIDVVGYFEKKETTSEKHIDESKLKQWVAKGAQLSNAVKKLL